MFRMCRMSSLVAWTPQNLELRNKVYTTDTDILRFFGILIPATRFQFNDRRDLWTSSPTAKYKFATNFSKTRMSRDRFEQLLECVAFSYCTTTPGDLS